MVDILHRVGVVSSPDEVYAALTTVDGLAGWWTQDTEGDGNTGGVIRFRFEPGGFDMKVLEAQPAERVVWEVADGPEEWVGTHHCSTKWATFLMSLKKLVETGKGEPAPHDVRISNWH